MTARYGLGAGDNPIFPGLWEAAELVAGGCHQPFEAHAHGPLGDVPDRDHAAPRPVGARQRLGNGLEPATRAVVRGHCELHPETLAAGGLLRRTVGGRQRHAGQILGDDLASAEQPIVCGVRRHDLAGLVDSDHRVAEAGEDRAQPIVLLDARPLLVLERLGLDAQLVGPGLEAFVRDAQLLDAGCQLLIECLELLVRRLEFLIEGLELLAACLGVLARDEDRLVRRAQPGDDAGELLVRGEQAGVGHEGPVVPALRTGQLALVLVETRDVCQLDDGAVDRRRVAPLRRDRHFDKARLAADAGGDVVGQVGEPADVTARIRDGVRADLEALVRDLGAGSQRVLVVDPLAGGADEDQRRVGRDEVVGGVGLAG